MKALVVGGVQDHVDAQPARRLPPVSCIEVGGLLRCSSGCATAIESVKQQLAEQVRRGGEITDTRRQGQPLVHEVSARIMGPNQNRHEIPEWQDNGIR